MPTPPTQIRIPHDLLSKIDWAAKAEGLTRTAWLLKAARASLTEDAEQDAANARATSEPPLPEPPEAPRPVPAEPSVPRFRCPHGCMDPATVVNPDFRCLRCRTRVAPC